MPRIRVGVQQAHCQRCRAGVSGSLDSIQRLRFVERNQHFARVEDALADFEAAPARHQWLRPPCKPVIELRPFLSRDVEDVSKSLGDQQCTRRTAPLRQRVGGNGRTVRQKRDRLRAELVLQRELANA